MVLWCRRGGLLHSGFAPRLLASLRGAALGGWLGIVPHDPATWRRGCQGFANGLLLVASMLVGYYAIELAFFRLLLPRISLNIVSHLPDTAGVLVQNSRSNKLPHDYVALFGDSYAEGVGDWLLQAHGNRAKPFHSAHVIHEATGRDVVSFGREGKSSAEALVQMPSRIFAGTRCSIFPDIEPPREIFVYFYEGNDADDNLKHLRHAAEVWQHERRFDRPPPARRSCIRVWVEVSHRITGDDRADDNLHLSLLPEGHQLTD